MSKDSDRPLRSRGALASPRQHITKPEQEKEPITALRHFNSHPSQTHFGKGGQKRPSRKAVNSKMIKDVTDVKGHVTNKQACSQKFAKRVEACRQTI